MKNRFPYQMVLISSIVCVGLLASGCDEYEREQLRQAGDDVGAAGSHVGSATDSAVGRARDGTADALRNLSDKIDTHNQNIDDSVDRIDQN